MKDMQEKLWIGLLLTAVCNCSYSESGGSQEFMVPNSLDCACPGSVLTFSCTTIGFGTTIWTGTAFRCLNSDNEITLRNSQFPSGSFGTCNNGAIAAHSLTVNGSCHTSQLNITVSSGLNQTSIECKYNSNTGLRSVGTGILTVILGSLYPRPENVTLASGSPEGLTFTWNAIAPMCLSIQYRISASNCGLCPTTSIATSVTCTNFQLSTESHICEFSVQSVTCGILGNQSDLLSTSIKVPEAPQIVIIPLYFNDSQSLKILTLNETDQSNMLNTNVPSIVQVTAYNIFVNSSSGHSMKFVWNITYDDGSVDVSLLCSSPATLSIIASAVNTFGEGPTSRKMFINCTNDFVFLKFDPSTSTMSCNFLTPSVASEKSCTVKYYKECQHERYQNASVVNGTLNPILLQLSLDEGMYCFVVTASNSTSFRIQVEGKITVHASGSSIARVLVAVVIPLVVILSVMVIILLLVLTVAIRKRKSVSNKQHNKTRSDNMRPIASFYQFSRTQIPLTKAGTTLQQCCDKYGHPVFLKVDKQLLKTLKRGDVQDVIILKKDSKSKNISAGELFTGPSAINVVFNEGHHDDWTKFVLIINPVKKTTPFDSNTEILHQNPKLQAATFHVLKVDEDNIEMKTYVEKHLGVAFNEEDAFHEFQLHQPEDRLYYKEVLHVPVVELQPDAKLKLKSHIQNFYDISGAPANCRVFLQNTPQNPKLLGINSWILYKINESTQK